ncbi:sterile alpha motif domain-containing protein 10 isoform X2 [Notamacropus eugenii]|uniref:sterile alpha motif domain-containing protein 10 isoform X2 n=1 Tax=Notamacropus eugenii TaxID=9315 RepID=UPI003B66ECCF
MHTHTPKDTRLDQQIRSLSVTHSPPLCTSRRGVCERRGCPMFTELRSKLSPPRGRAGAVRTSFGERRDVDAAAHFSFCRSLLEHTVSAENLPCRLQRAPGSSLTWHDSRSQRAAGGRTVKLLQQPGTETQQPHTGWPDAAGGPVEPAGCLQVVEEALSPQLPHLRGSLLPPCYHWSGIASVECRKASAHGAATGGPEAGGAAAGPAAAGTGRSPELAPAEPSFLWKHLLAPLLQGMWVRPQHCDG